MVGINRRLKDNGRRIGTELNCLLRTVDIGLKGCNDRDMGLHDREGWRSTLLTTNGTREVVEERSRRGRVG